MVASRRVAAQPPANSPLQATAARALRAARRLVAVLAVILVAIACGVEAPVGQDSGAREVRWADFEAEDLAKLDDKGVEIDRSTLRTIGRLEAADLAAVVYEGLTRNPGARVRVRCWRVIGIPLDPANSPGPCPEDVDGVSARGQLMRGSDYVAWFALPSEVTRVIVKAGSDVMSQVPRERLALIPIASEPRLDLEAYDETGELILTAAAPGEPESNVPHGDV